MIQPGIPDNPYIRQATASEAAEAVHLIMKHPRQEGEVIIQVRGISATNAKALSGVLAHLPDCYLLQDLQSVYGDDNSGGALIIQFKKGSDSLQVTHQDGTIKPYPMRRESAEMLDRFL